MSIVRVAVIGIGNMGASHARTLVAGEVPGAELVAVCDVRREMESWVSSHLPATVTYWQEAEQMMASGTIDAVIIATPHYDHPEQAIQAFQHGLHVMIEKPAGVYTKQVRKMNEAAAASGKVFSMMYNQRTNPLYIKLRDLIASGNWVRYGVPIGLLRTGIDPRVTMIPVAGGQLGQAKVAVY